MTREKSNPSLNCSEGEEERMRRDVYYSIIVLVVLAVLLTIPVGSVVSAVRKAQEYQAQGIEVDWWMVLFGYKPNPYKKETRWLER